MNLSVIIPCYNEGTKILVSLNKIVDFMQTKDTTYEIIVVNDGSTDNTLQILNSDVMPVISTKKDTQFKRFSILTYAKNKGKGYAVKKGIRHSSGDTVLFMDADLSTDLKAIDTVLEYRKYYDIIIGSRKLKNSVLPYKSPLIRQIISFCCTKLTNIIIPLHIKDTQCGFKAFDGNFARNVLIRKQRIHRFAFDVEYLYIAKLHNKTIREIPVIWRNDEDSKVTLLDSSLNFFICLFKIRRNKAYYKRIKKF